jgi:serine protease AprX
MELMTVFTKRKQREHIHSQNRFSVLPTPARLQAGDRYTGKGVTIAFIDSGFYPHPDLTEPVNRIIAFKDATQSEVSLRADRQPNSWDWHGTQTSVVAVGNGWLSDGAYRGLAPDAQAVLVKVSEQGMITERNIALGIRWVVENKERFNIRIVSISLGGDADAPSKGNIVDQAAEEAVRSGLIVVVAAGNSGNSHEHTSVPPANSPSVITVGGYTDNNRLGGDLDLYWSSYGQTADGIIKPELIAPAMWIAAPMIPGTESYERAEALSQIAHAPDYMLHSIAQLVDQPGMVLSNLASELWRKADMAESLLGEPPETIRALAELRLKDSRIVAAHYQHVDGTSFAAPIVASVAAQMIEANPGLTPDAIKHLLISTADRIPDAPAIRQGYGVLNARRAIEEAGRELHLNDICYFCAPRIESSKLIFTYHNDSAGAVALAGDFNDWDSAGDQFVKQENGVWQMEFAAPPAGRYLYKFIVDGNRWIDDPANAMKEADNYGGFNSVLNIA